MRIDKFLKVSRIIKRRTIANEACAGGRITINGKVAKPSAEVKTGDVISIRFGEHVGHQLGFPTANLEPDCSDKLIPAAGAYAVWTSVEGESQKRPAMMNIGTRPTFDGNHQTLEVNILDFDGNLYGKKVTVDFVERLRPEQRFESPEELAAQLHRDRKQVEKLLK